MKNDTDKEVFLKGLALSKGLAVGNVCRFNESRHSNLPAYKVEGKGIEREVARVVRAASIADERLETIRQETMKRIGPAEAEIFAVQQMILKDEKLLVDIERIIREEQANAESAVALVLDSYENRLRKIDDEYISERASDLGEIKRRILDILRNIDQRFQCADLDHCQRGRDRIVVAEELTPGMTMELDPSHTIGFVTESGGLNSHAAILARALGIPAVSGIKGIGSLVSCGMSLLVNGTSGEVVLLPSAITIARMKAAATRPGPPPVMPPVAGFRVMANISLASEAAEAMGMQAEGIGLYRTEFEFMAAGRFLSEDEQYEKYASVVRMMKGRPVTFRMFDAGGDKPLPFLDVPEEGNPALGWRGSRLLLGNPLLLRTQARAMARASRHGPVRILYPMVVDLEQFGKLKSDFVSALEGIDPGDLTHGVMFEVPSACMDAGSIMRAADFGSIGTNDLIQYLFAVDRDNAMVAYDYTPDRRVFWSLMGQMATAAAEAGKDLSVCGELAGDPRYIARIAELGISSVSVSAKLIPATRAAAAKFVHDRGIAPRAAGVL